MRILYLIDEFETNYPRDQNYIIKFMIERGHDVEIITANDPKFKCYDHLFFPNVKVSRFPVILRLKKANIYLDFIMPKRLHHSYDVVHAFTFFTFSSVYAIPIRSNIRVIRSEVGPPNGLNFLKAKHGVYRALISMYRNFYDVFTAYNQLEKRSLELLGFPSEKIIVLPPMIDFEIFSHSRKSYRDGLVIGILSRILPLKGVHRVVPIVREIMKSSPTVFHKYKLKLVLAGRMDNQAYAVNIIRELEKMLGPSFTYLGEVAPPYNFYKAVDIILVPSLIETGAITVLEAMAAGKCVIASNIYPINLYISHGLNGFLFNTSSEAARAILNVLEGCVNIKSISKEAQKYAKNHDYRIVCKSLEKIYHCST